MMRRDPALISTVTAIPVPDRPFFANLHLLLIKRYVRGVYKFLVGWFA